VVFRRDDEVLHAGVCGGVGPGRGVVEVGIETAEVFFVSLVGDPLEIAHPLVPRGEGVEAPVDEEAEAVAGEPRSVAAGKVFGTKGAFHGRAPV